MKPNTRRRTIEEFDPVGLQRRSQRQDRPLPKLSLGRGSGLEEADRVDPDVRGVAQILDGPAEERACGLALLGRHAGRESTAETPCPT